MFWPIFVKEWRDAWRDRKSLRMTLLMPVYFVGVFAATILITVHMSQQARVTHSEPKILPVMGAEHWPILMDWLTERGLRVSPVEAAAYQQVAAGKLDYALIVPEDAAERFETGETIELALVFDRTNNQTQGSVNYVHHQIALWNAKLGSLRLMSRGLSPALLQPVAIRELNVASDEKMGLFILLSLPFFLIITAFVSSVGLSADMVAGERERRSLESLLITAATSRSLVLGKWLASFLLTLLVLAVEMFLVALAFAHLPFTEIGLRVDVTLYDLTAIFAVLVSLAVLATSLQCLISLYAQSFKDAQTYMGIMVFIPMLPLFAVIINPSFSPDWFQWVPILGHHRLIKDVLLGGSVSAGALAQIVSLSMLLAMGLLSLVVKRLRQPHIVYGGRAG